VWPVSCLVFNGAFVADVFLKSLDPETFLWTYLRSGSASFPLSSYLYSHLILCSSFCCVWLHIGSIGGKALDFYPPLGNKLDMMLHLRFNRGLLAINIFLSFRNKDGCSEVVPFSPFLSLQIVINTDC